MTATTAVAVALGRRPNGRRPRVGPFFSRAAHLIVVLTLVTFAGVALSGLMPGSPASVILGPEATAEQVAELDAEFGFDQPLLVRYGMWLGSALQGDLGRSLQTNEPVLDVLLQRLPVTLELTVLALALALALAVPLALVAARREGGIVDRVVSGFASVLLSVPTFVSGVALVAILAIGAGLFPVAGWAPASQPGANLRFIALPVIVLALAEFPAFFRLLRGDLISTLREDFVTTARVRGLPGSYVLLRHVLRPSSIPLVTVAAVAFGRLIAGSIVVESLFSLPGLGGLAIQSIPAKDLPVIQGIIVLVGVTYVLVNLFVDGLHRLLDPRITR